MNLPKTEDYIDPVNPYTGEVSVIALMQNELNGHTTYPENMGDVISLPCDEKDQ